MPQLDECLRDLIAVLPQDPTRAREAIRELLARDSNRFLKAALPLLNGGDDSPGLQYLFVVMLANGLLPPCDPRLLSLEDEIRIARRVKEADPLLDVKLARRFSSSALEMDTAGRILEVLAAISDHSRVLPMLVQLMRHPNPRLRSKVALLVARSNRSAQTVEQMLPEPDARVRANAVEALWGVETQAARDVLWLATRDSDNRVMGNALLGLYRLGETGSVRPLLEMAAHERPLFRSTAAWTMGETGDPRFLPRLAQMVRETDSRARHSVFRAISRLNRAVAEFKQQPPLRVHAMELAVEPDGSRRLRVAVETENAGLRPTAFVLEENGRLVLDYAVEKQRPPESVALGLALPDEHVAAALERCLAVKRSADHWAILRFAAKPGTETPPPQCTLSGDANAVRRSAESGAAICPGSLDAMRLLAGALGSSAGARHIVLLQDWVREPGGADADAVGKLAQASSIAVHAIAVGAGPPCALETLTAVCQATGGRLLPAQSPEQFPDLFEKLYSGLLHSYEITYRTDAGSAPGEVRIQVYSPQGFGEDTLRP